VRRVGAVASIVAGIDVGSLTTEAALLEVAGNGAPLRLLGQGMVMTGHDARGAAEAALAAALAQAGLGRGDVLRLVATGYGRIAVAGADQRVTEITCHARGARLLLPATRTVIDIGGQDSKVIVLDDGGRVVDFAMNDKCAAGTGRFLEVMAAALGVALDDMGRRDAAAHGAVSISSMCTVFAESEVVSLIAAQEPRDAIIRGLHEAVAERTAALCARAGGAPPVAMTGGVAKNAGVVRALEARLKTRLLIPPDPQMAGAIGAALAAADAAAGPTRPAPGS